MNAIKDKLPGIALSAVIAFPAWIIGNRFPIIGSPVLGILFGMMLSLWKRPAVLSEGVKYTSKKMLQYSIILLGFDMNLFQVFQTGRETLLLMVFTLTATFLAAFYFGRLLKIDRDTNILIGVGTAICGGSAIAAASPVIRAKEEDVARSISTIFFFNVIAAFLFPFLGHVLHMTDYHFGLWAGTAINDTSSVVAAGYSFSNEAGNLAVIVKLTRTLMIIPVTLVLALHTAKRDSHTDGAKYQIAEIFPWFVLGFVAASVISTFLPLPAVAGTFLARAGKYVIVMAMAAIGLNTNLISLVKNGWKPIVLGLSCWAVLAVTSLLAQLIIIQDMPF